MLISDNTQLRKNYFDSNMIQKVNGTLLQCFLNIYLAADIDRNQCLRLTSSNSRMCSHYVGNVIYHKFSYGAVSYRFNWENVNAMLEFVVYVQTCKIQTILEISHGFEF